MVDIPIENGIVQLRENDRLEFKSALKGIPGSIWETYSAFANTFGGMIILGVEDRTGRIEGVPHTELRVQELWNSLNNPQVVNRNILQNDDISICEYGEYELIVIDVPRAERFIRPVFYRNLETGTFKRNGEGDYRCSIPEIGAMFRDQSESTADSSVLKGTSFADIDLETLRSYRNEMRSVNPDHLWNGCNDEEFARMIGAIGHGGTELTSAGLLMFGKEEAIYAYYPRFKLDYMECPQTNTSWTYRRVTGDGLWVGNIYNFFSSVRSRISADTEQPLKIDWDMHRVVDTEVRKAVRECLLNCLIHADYLGNLVVKIEKYPQRIVLTNSGLFRIPLETAEKGGESDPRNAVIAKMFSLLGLAERAGVGISFVVGTWKRQYGYCPNITENTDTRRTSVELVMTESPGLTRANTDILTLMRKDPDITVDSLSKELGVSRATVNNNIKVLKSKGLIKRIGGTRGRWECR